MQKDKIIDNSLYSEEYRPNFIWFYRGPGKGGIPLLPGMVYKEPTDNTNKKNDCEIPEFLKRQNPETVHRHRSFLFEFLKKIFQRGG